jgi:hypothetical protein
MQQNVIGSFLWEPRTHGFRTGSVPVRSFAAQRNIYYRTRTGTRTPVLIGEGRLLDPLWLIRWNNNIQRPVKPSLRRPQPLDLDVDGPPFRLDQLPVPFTDRLEVEAAAVTESQPRPQHGGTVA